ncbi:MAG: metallophosphoesterase [Bacteroides sp.]|nr:metallophosphoesterase [Bacteroides sp.]
MTRKKHVIIALSLAAAIFTPLLIWDNLRIETVCYDIRDKNIPEGFDGFRIVQVSDLHNNLFGEDQHRLIEAIKRESPDMIAITGDLIDSEEMSNSEAFIHEAVKIAPCYYVNGNHERWTGLYESRIKPMLLENGVYVLDNEKTYIERGGARLPVLGVSDRSYGDLERSAVLNELTENEGFTLLLSHRPEQLELYAESGASLVLTGHAHGGQVRIPFTRQGLYAPNQGIFPKYTEGVFKKSGTKMIVSRGLGNQVLIPRVNNCPQLVSVTLNTE